METKGGILNNGSPAPVCVLVAEDNDINWEILSELLRMHGIFSERAVNGLAAVERLTGAHPGAFDLVLMDIRMPGMDGLEAARAIRALEDPRARAVPILAMTAEDDAQSVRDCLDAGMNGHVSKPFDIGQILAEIRRLA